MVVISTVLLSYLALCPVMIVLQIFLLRNGRRPAGFILPIISFGLSLFFVSIGGTIDIYTLLLFNILTVILLATYALSKGKRNKRHDLDKMSIQDLA
jgi:hypothetical protein